MATTDQYEFIVVGGGPAGTAVASRLARSVRSPKVLLVEAGGKNADETLRIDGQRWVTFMNGDLNWGYKTTPQADANNRVIDYSRGLGLGGSSAINFGVFTIGARDDYDEWARLVGDEAFKWENAQKRLKALESYHVEVPEAYQKYIAADKSNHGVDGPLNVGFASKWEKDVAPLLEAFKEAGFPLNQDANSGNPIGMAPCINSAHKGRRTTAQDILVNAPENLTVLTNTEVDQLIISGKTVTGIISNGKQFTAEKEVILSAGALNSPKILMLSGVGPASELSKYSIPLVQDLPVGQNLRDHITVVVIFVRKNNDRGSFYGSDELMAAAREDWIKTGGGGLWSEFGCQSNIGYFKAKKLFESEEFKSLPQDVQAFLKRDNVPSYELFTHFPIHMLSPEMPNSLNYNAPSVFPMNQQSRGFVTLQSSNPRDPPLMDPKFLSHPYDRRAAIESLRALMEFTSHPAYARDTLEPLLVPKSNSDEDLLAFIKETLISVWHMQGTVKMGSKDDKEACVDNDFKLIGLSGIRVCDMSVVPGLPNNHPQATAYITGATLGDKLVQEYQL